MVARAAFTPVRFTEEELILATRARAAEQQRWRAAEHAGRDIGSRQESMAASELEVMQ